MCKCTPGVRTPYCGKVGCEWPEQKPEGARPGTPLMRFEYGDEVIVKRNGTVIGEGRVQEEIGTNTRTAAVVKFIESSNGVTRWADIAAGDQAKAPPFTRDEILNLIELCAAQRPTWAQEVVFKLVQHLFLRA